MLLASVFLMTRCACTWRPRPSSEQARLELQTRFGMDADTADIALMEICAEYDYWFMKTVTWLEQVADAVQKHAADETRWTLEVLLKSLRQASPLWKDFALHTASTLTSDAAKTPHAPGPRESRAENKPPSVYGAPHNAGGAVDSAAICLTTASETGAAEPSPTTPPTGQVPGGSFAPEIAGAGAVDGATIGAVDCAPNSRSPTGQVPGGSSAPVDPGAGAVDSAMICLTTASETGAAEPSLNTPPTGQAQGGSAPTTPGAATLPSTAAAKSWPRPRHR